MQISGFSVRCPSAMLLLVTVVMCSCGRRQGSSVILTTGETSKNYTVGTEWNDTKKRMISDLHPVWRELTSGTSRGFQMTRKVTDEVDPANSGTWISPTWRFFRNRYGRSGIEQLDGDASLEMISGISVEWRQVEDYLSSHLIQGPRAGIQKGESGSRGD